MRERSRDEGNEFGPMFCNSILFFLSCRSENWSFSLRTRAGQKKTPEVYSSVFQSLVKLVRQISELQELLLQLELLRQLVEQLLRLLELELLLLPLLHQQEVQEELLQLQQVLQQELLSQ